MPPREPTASAEPAESELPRNPNGPRRWYGWQLLIIDGAIFAGLGIATAADIRGSAATGLGISLGLAFDVGAPIVHAVHHRGAIGWASNRCLNTTSANAGAYLGLAAASAIDASLFAWDAPAAGAAPRSQTTLQWAPVLTPCPDGASLGVVGVF